MAYPGTIDSYTPVQGTSLLASVDHAGQHNQAGSAVVALENKLGIGSGSAAANQILVGSGAGTTAWGTIWNNGALGSPTITGGTVNSAIFGTPTLNAPTIQSLADNTTGNVSITAHGLVPKAPNDTAKFLRGDGVWATGSLSGKTLNSFTVTTLGSSYNSTSNTSEQEATGLKVTLPIINATCTVRVTFSSLISYPTGNADVRIRMGTSDTATSNTEYGQTYGSNTSRYETLVALASLDLSSQNYVNITVQTDISGSFTFSAFASRTKVIVEIFS